MRLELITGCVNDDILINGISEINLTGKERVRCLTEIGRYIACLPYDKAFEMVEDILTDYESEGDLDFADSFYQLLIEKEIIEPLEQIKNMKPAQVKYVVKLVRAELSMFVRDLDPEWLNYLLQVFIPFFYDECETTGPCPQCGDYTDHYTLKI